MIPDLGAVDWVFILTAWLILGLLIGARLGLVIRRADETAPRPEYTDLAIGLPDVPPPLTEADRYWLADNHIDADSEAAA